MNWVQRMWECNKSDYQHFFPLIFLHFYSSLEQGYLSHDAFAEVFLDSLPPGLSVSA